MRTEYILNYVRNLKKDLEGFPLDPGFICKTFGFPIRKITLNPNVYKAYTNNINGTPIINLNVHFNKGSQMLLCAHELGHAFLHKDNVYNAYDGDNTIQEYEANLFAFALLLSDETLSELNIDLKTITNYEMESIITSNLKLNPNNEKDYSYY